MAIPSSPPLMPEVDLPSSPPHVRLDPSQQLHRKRHLPDYDSLSSDPIFSDDTNSTGAEEWQPGPKPKRKRMIKGPWWSLGKHTRPPKMGHDVPQQRRGQKTHGFRNADSGVWMGSDLSDTSIDSVASSQSDLPTLDLAHPGQLRRAGPESVAADIIHGCVEHGRETVDLSDHGLTHLSSETLRPLHQLIRPTHFTRRHPPSEDEFTPLTPAIQLFLASNRLASLPAEVFALENITVLSVRGNELTSLPPAIGRLRRLQELNIAGNRIEYLPWELLEILRSQGKQHQISVRPNPLIRPTLISGPSTLSRLPPSSARELENLSRCGDTQAYHEEQRQRHLRKGELDLREELELRLKLGRMLRTQHLQEASRAGTVVNISAKELIFLASSDIRYFTVNGTWCRSGAAGQPTELQDIYRAHLDPAIAPPPSHLHASRVPSLFELATRSVQEHYDLPDLQKHHLPQLPDNVGLAVQRAAKGDEYGNETCSTCHRSFVTSQAEWVEFWFSGVAAQPELTQESVLPFLRKACSWACAHPTEVGDFAY